MKTRLYPLVALALAGVPAAASATELGRLDIAAPGAMVSACAGIDAGNGSAIGDKPAWVAGRNTCNAVQTALPYASVAQAASYQEPGPAAVNAAANGQAVMGQTRLFAHSRAYNDAGIAAGAVTGGWVDNLTLTPANPADIGKTASFTFAIDVQGTLAGQGATDSFNSRASLGIRPYVDDLSLTDPVFQFLVGGQGQQFSPYNQTVNQIVSFSTDIVLGTPFELGIFARALAGNASATAGAPFAISEATVDFSNTISWAGISSLTLNGNPVAYSLSSASGIDWTQPYATAVPEPQTWALMLAGIGIVAGLRQRRFNRLR